MNPRRLTRRVGNGFEQVDVLGPTRGCRQTWRPRRPGRGRGSQRSERPAADAVVRAIRRRGRCAKLRSRRRAGRRTSRYSVRLASRDGDSLRRSVICSASLMLSTCPPTLANNAVRTGPGPSTGMYTPNSRITVARLSMRPSTANLAALYASLKSRATTPFTLVRVIIRPAQAAGAVIFDQPQSGRASRRSPRGISPGGLGQ
jgi:hypothetical protein